MFGLDKEIRVPNSKGEHILTIRHNYDSMVESANGARTRAIFELVTPSGQLLWSDLDYELVLILEEFLPSVFV